MQRIIDSRMRNSLSMAFARIRLIHPFEPVSLAVAPWLLGGVLCVVAMTASVSIEASGLTKRQAEQARSLTMLTHWPRARTLVVPHPLGLQTLSIEKQERKNQHTTRWVNVYQYHYTLQAARLVVIDLETNTVSKQSPVDSVHLPLNDTEIDFAISLLSDKEALITRLRLEQIQRNQPAFASLSELDIKASIFEPLDTLHNCHAQRCALVSMFDRTRTVFRIEPIVNLTTIQVETLGSQ
jgi:hypothetical protein